MDEVWQDFCFAWRHYPFEMAMAAILGVGAGLFAGAAIMLAVGA